MAMNVMESAQRGAMAQMTSFQFMILWLRQDSGTAFYHANVLGAVIFGANMTAGALGYM